MIVYSLIILTGISLRYGPFHIISINGAVLLINVLSDYLFS